MTCKFPWVSAWCIQIAKTDQFWRLHRISHEIKKKSMLSMKNSNISLSEPDKKLNFFIFLYLWAFEISSSAELSVKKAYNLRVWLIQSDAICNCYLLVTFHISQLSYKISKYWADLTNTVEPDQTTSKETVWSRPTHIVYNCLHLLNILLQCKPNCSIRVIIVTVINLGFPIDRLFMIHKIVLIL